MDNIFFDNPILHKRTNVERCNISVVKIKIDLNINIIQFEQNNSEKINK